MRVLVSVFNNLFTDQRVEKVCRTLHNAGYEIFLIGNDWGGLPDMARPYLFYHIPLKSKVLRYAYLEFNRKLYFELLKHTNPDTVLLSNDLDTLFPNYLVSKKLKLPLVYDSHEIFTEMPSLKGRWVKKVWQILEKSVVPKVKYMMTANESYSQWYAETYRMKRPVTIQNFPIRKQFSQKISDDEKSKVILYQGVINPYRGLDKIIPAMKNINAELWIAGDGPKKEELVTLTNRLKLNHKIKFLGKLSPDKLREITPLADVGLSIEEHGGLSYFYTLPNKIADYIQAGVPIVTSNFPEMMKIQSKYDVGEVIMNHSENELINKINSVLIKGKIHFRNGLETAAADLCWDQEVPKLLMLFRQVEGQHFS